MGGDRGSYINTINVIQTVEQVNYKDHISTPPTPRLALPLMVCQAASMEPI